MLTRLTLGNFKPLAGLHTLELSRLTVLAGLNSTGKSSVIQAILAITQTLDSSRSEKALLLNGKLTQLGTFDSVINESAQADARMSIGFELDLSTHRRQRQSSQHSFFGFYHQQVKRYSFDGKFYPTQSERRSAIESSDIRLESATVLLQLAERDPLVYKIRQEPVTLLDNLSREYKPLISNQEAIYSADTTDMEIEGPNPLTIAQLTHFIPERLLSTFPLSQRRREYIGNTLKDQSAWQPLMYDAPVSIENHRYTVKFHEDLKGLHLAFGIPPPPSSIDFFQLRRIFHSSALNTTRKRKFRDKLVELVYRDIFPGEDTSNIGLEPTAGRRNELLRSSAQLVTSYFGSNVRYIGPLRADPLSPLGFSGGDADDVGTKGQLAAAVFEANKKQTIDYLPPGGTSVERDSLENALDRWSKFIGVAHHLSTSEFQPAGMSWRVQMRPEAVHRDLQAVGVGVSQLLPVLVAGLLAPAGATLLLEQPELHLHPRAQSRLSHFLLALAQLGKQCIVETHSEYLVNELRAIRISNANVDKLACILFANQDAGGHTEFKRVAVGEYGGTADWPEGFFDESSRQEQEITRLALLKRAKASVDDD